MENGPSNHNGEAEQVWERPWTLDEMRKSSSNWSLAADSGLFLYLQDFSQRMLSKTHDIEKQLDGLIRDTKATDSCLHTVFNDFLMLSNTQFIENRVYDEEVEEPAPKTEAQEKRPDQEKTREQKEAELIPKVQEAVNYGLKVLESAFEQLDIKAGNSDSEDEEAADRVEPILEPKDLYVDRPLPYLIGSQAFMEQEDVGLGDLSSDEMSIDSDRESVIESDEEKDAEHSDEDFDQEEEGQENLKKKSSVVSSDEEEEEDEDSDIFGESDKDEDEATKDEVGPTSFADELAARIKGDTTSKPESDRTSLSSGPSVSKKKNKGKKLPKASVDDDSDEMFRPPKMDEDEFSPFGGKGGLFSGGKGLFDDDDEGDLFSEAPKDEPVGDERLAPQTTESAKTKKIPTGAVSIFPENNLFGSPKASESAESKENGSPVKPKVQAAPAALGGGLFDDDDDDDFFSGKPLKKPTSAGQEKHKPKKTVDLFGGDEHEDDDDDGDIFCARAASTPQQSKKTVEEEEEVVRPPEKKLPAGAISMFGPGTKNLLVEGLKRRQPSTSEESEKSEESVPPPELKQSSAPKTAEKVHSKSLFSDDEDSQIFSTLPKGHSKTEAPTTSKPSKTSLSIFDDDEEDLFSSVPKTKSIQVKPAALQPKKTVSSSLFSDDEDQWISSTPSTVKPEVKSGGMKASVSAPSSLPSAKPPQKDGLFDEGGDGDLFAATKETSKKKPQRVSLLFEDEDDEDKGSLFGFKPPENKTTPEAKVPAATSQTASLFGSEEKEKVVSASVVDKIAEEKPSDKKPVLTVPSPEESSTGSKKKPVGAVSLFGGINVLGDGADTVKKQSKGLLDDFDDLDWHKEAPPPMESKEKKTKKTALSLFDDDDDDDNEDDEPDEASPFSIAAKPTDKSSLKPQEEKAHVKSTGVFQDEELLFSHTQQRDNDPDVDLFATTSKPSAPLPSSVKTDVPTLFGDDEDDDLFSSAKPKAPPKIPEKPSKPKKDELDKGSSTSQSSQKEANLAINPASLLPGAAPRVPGGVSVISGLAPSHSARASGPLPGFAGPPEPQARSEGAVSFDTPAQVTTLQSANKDRAKVATKRRPQTRAARQIAAQRSVEARRDMEEVDSEGGTASSMPPFNPISARPSALTLPVTTTSSASVKRHADESVRPKIPPVAPVEEDLFSSEDLFASASVPKHTPSPQLKTKPSGTAPNGAPKKEASVASKKDPTLSIFDDHGEDLFAVVKPKPGKKAKAVPFLDDENDDDIFKTEKKKDSKLQSDSTKADIFQDDKETPSKALKKPKEASLDASLFDDDVDIFADLTPTTKPKGKKVKKKVETKSIFDDDMDDIFSSGITKPVAAPSSKAKKPTQEPSSAEESGHSIFDDPLNVFGGN